MLKISTAILVVATLSVAFVVQFALAVGKEIYLPPDDEVITIVGKGFKLQVTQFDDIKDKWENVAQEAAQVESPRIKKDDTAVNANLYERIKMNFGDKAYGSIEDDLLAWIENRATALADRIDRYREEIADGNLSRDNNQKAVVEILLLNTLTDLENLNKENLRKKNFRSMKWIKNKVNSIASLKSEYEKDVSDLVDSLIRSEKGFKSTNRPSDLWLTNVRAIMRIQHEQRFSDSLNKKISDYLSGTIAMMERARVYEAYMKDGKIQDILYYHSARGRVPPHFPFASQDAIMNDA